MKTIVLAVAFLATTAVAQQRIASDFEIEQMERQIARSRAFLAQISARLNLGDLRMSRNEMAAARAEYEKARQAAERERVEMRRESKLAQYATATMYAGLAEAKLGRTAASFALFEEALRYASDDPKTWNLYSSAMSILGLPRKAIAASRNAVAIAERELQRAPSVTRRLDLAIYQHALATALVATDEKREAETLLVRVIEALNSRDFESLRRAVERGEAFEVYSSARGDEAAYLSLLNRAQLRLAALYEGRGDVAAARRVYLNVLASRTDDPTALAALARLATSAEERERYFADAFDANPFSIPLIREYQRHLAGQAGKNVPHEESPGARVRAALQQMQRGEHRAARATLDALLARFAGNDALNYLSALNDIALGDAAAARRRRISSAALRREVDERLRGTAAAIPSFLRKSVNAAAPSAAELRQLMGLIASGSLTADQRIALDRIVLTSRVTFDVADPGAAPNQTVLTSGRIEDVPFRFAEPTIFGGTFAAGQTLTLTYRILGVTATGGTDALLLEPLRLEVPR